MSATVTSIRAGDQDPPGSGGNPPKKWRARKIKLLQLQRFGDDGRIDTLDAISGLQGVCSALEDTVVVNGGGAIEQTAGLCIAAKLLADLISRRVAD